MGRKKNHDYFSMLVDGVSYACAAAEMLNEYLQDFEPEKLSHHIEEMHKIEHAADIAKHEMLQKLLKEFITTIDREDILELADVIDDVTDSLEDVLLRMYMYNITQLREEALEFSAIIIKCCREMKIMMEEFPNVRKSKKLKESIIEINRLEEEGDQLFTEAMHRLYADKQADPVDVMAWTLLYDQLEHCCDRCEDVSEAVERVILTNS